LPSANSSAVHRLIDIVGSRIMETASAEEATLFAKQLGP